VFFIRSPETNPLKNHSLNMERYKGKLNHPTGVSGYEIGDQYIILEFEDKDQYMYNYTHPGKEHVEKMKRLAQIGSGLNTYVSKHVGKNYFKKLDEFELEK